MALVVVMGCGYIGHRVAALEQSQGNRVMGLARSEKTAQRLQTFDIHPFQGDLDEPDSLKNLPINGSLLYYFVPPPSSGVTDQRMQNLVSMLISRALPERIVLISTTGLYGDCKGDWISEDRPPNPKTERALRRLAAEKTLVPWGQAQNVDTVILRVAGIYGPGRLPEKRLRRGEPVLCEEESPFSNRIHADDLAQACCAAARRGKAGSVYNITDGHPTTMTDYFFRVADLLGLQRPPTVSLEEASQQMGPGMLSYLSESRRIENQKMRKELKVDLRYPDLARGLPSCLRLTPLDRALTEFF